MLQKANRLPRHLAEAPVPACVPPPVRAAAVAVEAAAPVGVSVAAPAAVRAAAEDAQAVAAGAVQRAVTAAEVLAREGAEKDAIRPVTDVQSVQKAVWAAAAVQAAQLVVRGVPVDATPAVMDAIRLAELVVHLGVTRDVMVDVMEGVKVSAAAAAAAEAPAPAAAVEAAKVPVPAVRETVQLPVMQTALELVFPNALGPPLVESRHFRKNRKDAYYENERNIRRKYGTSQPC